MREIPPEFQGPDVCWLCLVCADGLKVEKELIEQNLVLAKPDGLSSKDLLFSVAKPAPLPSSISFS